jgi:hypothetical protein
MGDELDGVADASVGGNFGIAGVVVWIVTGAGVGATGACVGVTGVDLGVTGGKVKKDVTN